VPSFIVKIKRAETPFYRTLHKIASRLMYFDLPLPRFLRPLFRFLYNLHFVLWNVLWRVYATFYATPLFRGRCESAGKRLFVFRLPHVTGHTRIHVGDHVLFNGKVAISSGRVFDQPTLILKDRVTVGHMVLFFVNREIVIEEGVSIASRCVISDNDGHPRDAALRAQHLPPPKEEIKPVRICRNAWIADDCHIRKGVTVGEGAIVGMNSVVLKDVPPYCIVMGNPARVVGFAPGATRDDVD
jgi:Bacterial transferase hexapeptide (six repeats)